MEQVMISLKDVAAELDLSVSVVSRALNPSPDANARVAEKTRQRILEACQRLGYRHNRMAEFVKRRRFPGIGVFLPRKANSLIANLIFGISEEAGDKDFPLLIHTGMDEESYRKFMLNNLDLSAGGIITYSVLQYHQPGLQELLQEYCDNGGKVLILNDCTAAGYTKLYMDEYYGGQLAADMLLRAGCRNFFCLGEELCEEKHSSSNSVNQMRYEGFREQLQKHGAECRSVASIETLTATLQKTPGSGVFAVSDLHALALMQRTEAAGLRAPEDFKLTGYDDMDWSGPVGLSSIRQPFCEEGRRAAAKIMEMIYGWGEKDEALLPCAVPRKTTEC